MSSRRMAVSSSKPSSGKATSSGLPLSPKIPTGAWQPSNNPPSFTSSVKNPSQQLSNKLSSLSIRPCTKPPGTALPSDFPAHLTDKELIQRFTPLEHKFFAFFQSGEYTARERADPDGFEDHLQKQFPGETELLEKWLDFGIKWLDRHTRRRTYAMSRKVFLDLVQSTPCRDACALARNLYKFMTYNTPDLLLGESKFGGTMTGYAIATRPHVLNSDIADDTMSNPNDGQLLDDVVLGINFNHNPSAPALQPSRMGGVGNRISSQDMGSSSVMVQSATSANFFNTDPFCVFQIGELMACTGSDWIEAKDSGGNILSQGNFKSTGYGVVVKLNPNGYPTGTVYIVYNFRRSRELNEGGSESSEEIIWRDSNNNELQHVRRLYPLCRQKFFMAKIANRLEDLTAGGEFNFDIIRVDRAALIRAKKEGPRQRIIPNDVLASSCTSKENRPRRHVGQWTSNIGAEGEV